MEEGVLYKLSLVCAFPGTGRDVGGAFGAGALEGAVVGVGAGTRE